VLDTTPPVLSGVTNKTITAGQSLVFDTPTATDAGGACTIVIVGTTTNTTVADGSYTVTRTWCATDPCGNQCSGLSQTVTVNPAVVVVPKLDRLTISVGPASIVLRWPTNAADYRLESAVTQNAARWTPVAVTPTNSNGVFTITLPTSGPSQFFRLNNGPPMLELSVSGGSLHLKWPAAPSGFQVESCDAMHPGNWTPVSLSPASSNAFNFLDVPLQPASSAKWFRLKK
jgi:hypothetical protein